jgi:hypothetical protein
MLADFLRPAERELGEKGLVTMYYRDHVQQAAVDEQVGKTIELAETGVKVELVHYLAEAKLDAAGKFQPISEEPRNPLVELRVQVPDEDEPFRQVAFAKSPLLNLDGVYDRVCPVKFVYQHPKFQQSTAVEFMQGGDGKLYGRTIAGGKFKANGEVGTGSHVDIPGGFTLKVTDYLPHAKRQISFGPAKDDADEGETSEPAMQVEIAIASATEKIWLQRNHLQFQRRTIDMPDGPLEVHFGAAHIRLGFSLRLVDFYQEANSRPARNASFSCVVRLIDEDLQIDDQRPISSVQPLTYKGFKFTPIGSRPAGHQKDALIFRAAYKPGSRLKYGGTVLLCLGFVAT